MTFSLAWRMLQVVNISCLFGALVLQKSSKILLSVSLEVELGFHRLKPISYKPERRTQKGFYAQEPYRVLLSFICTTEICKHHELELFFSGESVVFISIPLIGLLVPLEEIANK